jgi:hypothetical protein
MAQIDNRQMIELLSTYFIRRNEGGTFVPLTTPLTSTSWDGDSFSTTTKTKIDLSSVFGVPAGVKMVKVKLSARDSGSASHEVYFQLSPNDTHLPNAVLLFLSGTPNNKFRSVSGDCPCDKNGDIYYEISASGTDTMDVYMEIWGYWI